MAPVESADCCVGSGGVVVVAVVKTGGAAGEPGPAMAAVVGNMASAARGAVVKMAAEATDQGLSSDTSLLRR
jgi:hypothetical protein